MEILKVNQKLNTSLIKRKLWGVYGYIEICFKGISTSINMLKKLRQKKKKKNIGKIKRNILFARRLDLNQSHNQFHSNRLTRVLKE